MSANMRSPLVALTLSVSLLFIGAIAFGLV
jgi:hypothetical protein